MSSRLAKHRDTSPIAAASSPPTRRAVSAISAAAPWLRGAARVRAMGPRQEALGVRAH
jgi:hypothetical protein